MSSESPKRSGDRMVVLGRITGAFGIQGWVKVESYTEPPDNILAYPQWQLARNAMNEEVTDFDSTHWQPVKPLTGRTGAKGVHAQLEGIVDRTQAEGLRGRLIAIPRSALPPTAPGEYYWDDLLGLDAYTKSAERLGKIAEIRATTAHDLLAIIDDSSGERIEHLVPMVKERLVAVDLTTRRVTVDWDSSW